MNNVCIYSRFSTFGGPRTPKSRGPPLFNDENADFVLCCLKGSIEADAIAFGLGQTHTAGPA